MNNREASLTRGKRVRYIRETILNLNRPDFCKNSSLNESTMKGWELAKHGGLTEKGAKKLVDHLAHIGLYCNINWLLHGIGPYPQKMSEFKVKEDEPRKIDQLTEELLIFRQQGLTLDMVIRDDTMLPFYEKDDYVAGCVAPIELCINKRCILQDTSGQKYAGYFKKLKNGGCYQLVAVNFMSLSGFTMNMKPEKGTTTKLAPIIWHRKLK